MSTPNTPTQPTTDADHHRVLQELITIGMDLARDLRAVEAPAETKIDGFDRIARAVRRTILLARSLDTAPAPHRLLARKRLIREVEDAITQHTEHAEAEARHAELRERLDASELEEELAARPVAEIITDIIRDLGLSSPLEPSRKRRTPAEAAILHARAAAPQGAANNPAWTLAWPRRDTAVHDRITAEIDAILNPTRFRGK